MNTSFDTTSHVCVAGARTSACSNGGNANGSTGGMDWVLAEVASGEQCFSHNGSLEGARCSAAIAAWQSGVLFTDIESDIDIDALAGTSGIVQASADIASCCNSRQAVSKNTITERWRREWGMAGI